ncbi:MAG: hypothetical protein FJ125_04245 [Deltaproteobacteria bacterium]|nr:hypothetical protein [Deltaproteobacteria bacterium]
MTREQRSRTGSLKVKDEIHASEDSHIQVEECCSADEVTIMLTQAFCARGHNLIQAGNSEFDGQPGIRLRICCEGETGEVTLSPIHGDHRKQTHIGSPPTPGKRISVRCPQCDEELPISGECAAGDGGMLRVLYLSQRLDEGHAALVCDIWGCPYSKVVDEWSLLSEVILQEMGAK